jgi:(p)ppGpp synthase/HD superfamily hydrolase
MFAFSERYDAALAFAARAHRDQLRKGTDIPYITHVVHVSTILLRHGFDEDLAIAGLLHDVIEDCGVSPETVAAEFGAEVARLVVAVSKPPGDLEWEAAKTAKLDQIAAGGPAVAALKAADAIHNAHSVSHDLRRLGPIIWERFKRGPEPTLGYYTAILTRVRGWLGDHPIFAELAATVAELDQSIKRT